MVKADSLGIEMTRKTKRLGCSGIKDLLENNKIDIKDENTILEISTFVSKGVSYEAQDGNHDDLMMNLVMFGYFISTQFFGDMTDINIKDMMFKQRMKEIDDDLPGFGYISNAVDDIPTLTEDQLAGRSWAVEDTHDF
jgi:hypothetical protein